MESMGANPDPKSSFCVQFTGVTDKNISEIKKINSALFPIQYSAQMYHDMVACGDVTQLAIINGDTVGAIGCRLQMKDNGRAKLYILTLGVLAPYRNEGIGTQLLQRSLEVCKCDDVIEEAELHVQVSNEDAIRFYKRHGFEVAEVCHGYYPRLEPSDAVLLKRPLHPSSDSPG